MINGILLSNIRELCKKNNISVADLEKNLGIGAGTISRWNKANPSFDKITAIAKYFKVSIDELSGYHKEADSQKPINEETIQIIDYLTRQTVEADETKSFWQDYKNRSDDIAFVIDGLPSMNSDAYPNMVPEMSRLFYASDEIENYLLEVFYCMDKNYDFETNIRLYLVAEESEKPDLECDDKQALQELYVAVANKLKTLKVQVYARKKRSELLNMINNSAE